MTDDFPWQNATPSFLDNKETLHSFLPSDTNHSKNSLLSLKLALHATACHLNLNLMLQRHRESSAPRQLKGCFLLQK
jgi:hypothetical protein